MSPLSGPESRELEDASSQRKILQVCVREYWILGSKYVEQTFGSGIEAGYIRIYSILARVRCEVGSTRMYSVCHRNTRNAGQVNRGDRVIACAQLLFS